MADPLHNADDTSNAGNVPSGERLIEALFIYTYFHMLIEYEDHV
jgi:hypothetical protein